MATDPMTSDTRLTDANKLRLLARWFDMWDAKDDQRRRAILDDQSFPGKNDVQRDLLRIAATIDAVPLDVERLLDDALKDIDLTSADQVRGADKLRRAVLARLASPEPREDALPREFRFTQWDDTTLVITVDDEDPGDMGEPRTLVDYDDGPTTYVSVRAALAQQADS